VSRFGRDVLIALISGIIALGVSLVTVISTNASLTKSLGASREGQANEFRETREAEARNKNAEVYQALLAAADAYYVSFDSLCEDTSPGENASWVGTPDEPRCEKAYLDSRNLEDRYNHAANALYIYGSDEAWQAYSKIDQALDKAIYTKEDDGYDSAYGKFQQVMCHDLSAVPGGRCDKAPRPHD